MIRVIIVADDLNIYFPRLRTWNKRIELAVPAESHCAVVGDRQRTYGMFGEPCELCLARTVTLHAPYVECAVLLADIDYVTVCSPIRILVVAVEIGELGVFLPILDPYIVGARRTLMFAEIILIAFLVFVHNFAVTVEIGGHGIDVGIKLRTPRMLCIYGVQLVDGRIYHGDGRTDLA